jgi:hypothetical protein
MKARVLPLLVPTLLLLGVAILLSRREITDEDRGRLFTDFVTKLGGE